ncbi:MAG: cupin domain-containing protein [Cyclobacteriaceae bacterium]
MIEEPSYLTLLDVAEDLANNHLEIFSNTELLQTNYLDVGSSSSSIKPSILSERLFKVLSGNLTVFLDGFSITLGEGDVIYFPEGFEPDLQSNTSTAVIIEIMLSR